MTTSFAQGPQGTVAFQPTLEQAVTFVDGTGTAAATPTDAALAFQKAATHGYSSFGTFTCNGTSAVTIADINMKITSIVDISLNTVGGTVGAIPTIQTITAGTGFTTKGTASDTSVYNYSIFNPVSNSGSAL